MNPRRAALVLIPVAVIIGVVGGLAGKWIVVAGMVLVIAVQIANLRIQSRAPRDRR